MLSHTWRAKVAVHFDRAVQPGHFNQVIRLVPKMEPQGYEVLPHVLPPTVGYHSSPTLSPTVPTVPTVPMVASGRLRPQAMVELVSHL